MASRNPFTEDTTRQLKEDLHHLTRTIEDLVSATADDSRGHVKELRERAEKRLKETRERLEARGERLYDDARSRFITKPTSTTATYTTTPGPASASVPLLGSSSAC